MSPYYRRISPDLTRCQTRFHGSIFLSAARCPPLSAYPTRCVLRQKERLRHFTGRTSKKLSCLPATTKKAAKAIAEQLGLDETLAEVLPEDKASYISAEQTEGRTVIMIGDGINDTPALSLADVGIAVGNGAVIAREIADVTIAADDLTELVYLKQLSDRLMRRIHGNYRFVIGFNGVLILLGALGLLTPAVSALLHNTSTLLLGLH